MKRTPVDKRNELLQIARYHAIKKNSVMVEIWLERAQSFHPVSELQLWRIKQLLGPTKFHGLNFEKMGIENVFEFGGL